MSNSTCLAQSLRASYVPTNFALQLIKNRILSSPRSTSSRTSPFFPALPLSDGVGRTGTFICLHSQLERLKTEGVVDFLQAVKASRIQRPGLVPDAFSLHSLLTGHHTLAQSLVLKTYSTLKQSGSQSLVLDVW